MMYQSIIEKHNKIALEEESHVYTLLDSEIEFSSVTEFINTFFKPFNDKKIAKKLSGYGKYKDMTSDDILIDWANRRIRGTNVHKEIENFVNSNIDAKDKIVDLKSKQGIDFLKKKCMNKENTLFSEVKICSEQLKLAGTIDLMIYNKPKNRIYLIDWKTNADIKKTGYNKGIHFTTNLIDDCSFNRYTLQLSMYQYILEKFYHAYVDGLYILHLKDYTYEIMKCDFKKDYILNMIQAKKNE